MLGKLNSQQFLRNGERKHVWIRWEGTRIHTWKKRDMLVNNFKREVYGIIICAMEGTEIEWSTPKCLCLVLHLNSRSCIYYVKMPYHTHYPLSEKKPYYCIVFSLSLKYILGPQENLKTPNALSQCIWESKKTIHQ